MFAFGYFPKNYTGIKKNSMYVFVHSLHVLVDHYVPVRICLYVFCVYCILQRKLPAQARVVQNREPNAYDKTALKLQVK